ncbi:MAG: hypothetical protein AMJ84_00250 [Acidithiobacillales bacterium SM23_46]|nr:MAG: hypothetical protein AMJ84_00250 [Acidithiobacillales bacterium SM23_46]KPL29013.1 MAG: hypothetical protein AMJ72_00200 [Acidithiobacillales bacterium SM1_46]
MAVKRPGFNNASGSRNRRVNRYANAGDNRPDRRHKVVAGTTIGFNTVPTPDEVTDSANGLGGYEVGEYIGVEGSTGNDGVLSVQTVAAGALGVNEALTLEGAGAAVRLASLNNEIVNRFS